ncbi:MAG: alpha/beta hydrolase [Lachnospiraceae bacterium]|nr:alpha/beta hydrolase [Lachnospiraceae bacterium]
MIVRIGRDGEIEREIYKTIQETLVEINTGHFYAMEYVPINPTETSQIAVILMHCDQNYMGLKMGPALAQRGYHVLACESVVGGEIERKFRMLDSAICYLRQNKDIEKIILMGHSGGATLMTAYQSIAENGPEIYQGEEMIYKCTLREKPAAADGLMLIDANYGNGVMSLLSMDPAVEEEGNGMKLNPEYDIFDPANGYDPAGAHYSEEFIRKYQAAQRARNDKLIDLAKERLEKIQKGEGNYVDDEPFFITAADQPKPNNRLLPEDTRLLSHTKGEYDLVHGDGSITHERIYSLRTPECDCSFSNTYGMGVNKNTVRGFLSSQALRTTDEFAVCEDGIAGVDWKSGYASPIGNIDGISVPTLIMGMTGGYEYLASEMIYERAKMEDVSIAFVRGATHMFFPNRDAEKTPGEFGDTENVLYDYMAKWMKRFT